jgi:hypothetical protein
MNASLNEKLGGVEWGEYRIGDIFTKVHVKKAQKSNVRKYRNSEFYIPVVYCKFGDNGIMYWGRKGEFTTCRNAISVVYNGAIAAGKVYAQKEEKGILAESYFIKLKNYNASHNINLYLASALEKTLYHLYSRDNLATWNGKVENDKIILPMTQDGNIDFDFMESFITELEKKYVVELNKYLSVTGIKDTHLSHEEEQALTDYNKLEWGKFNLEALYGKSTRGKRLKSADRIPGKLPFVTAGEADEGVSDFIGNNVQVFSKNTTTIDMFGSAKYRNYEYGGDDHIAVVHTEKLPMKAAIFVTTAIHKSSHNGQFDYGRNFYAKDADNLDIVLPVKDGKPDYGTMETIISAIQKLVVAKVSQYTERKIQTT